MTDFGGKRGGPEETIAALRQSEALLRFPDQLGRATAGLSDADAILALTTKMVGEHLGISVCAYADMDEDEDGFTIRGDWSAPGSISIVGHYRLADFGKLAVHLVWRAVSSATGSCGQRSSASAPLPVSTSVNSWTRVMPSASAKRVMAVR